MSNHTPDWREQAQSHATRFWGKIRVGKDDECWPWLAHLSCGYGSFSIGRWKIKAHRFAFFLSSGGLLPECVCHACDNPPCCNPAHLWAGSRLDNVRDAIVKGRLKMPVQFAGERNSNASLNDEKVASIRSMANLGHNYRAIADAVGCSRSNVCLILRGKRWGHSVADSIRAGGAQ